MTAAAQVDVKRIESVVVASILGEVDLTNAAEVVDDLLAAVTNDAVGLVIDVSATRYLDSTGVGALFEAVRRVHGRGQSMALVAHATAPTRRLLGITGIDNVVPIADTVDDAVAAVRATV